MKFLKITVVSVFLVCIGAKIFAEANISVPSQSLITLDTPSGWSVGFRGQMGAREFKAGDDVWSMETIHAVGRLGYSFLPFLHGLAELGWCRVERTDDDPEKGESGLEWAVGLKANLIEHVISRSPVLGKQKVAGLGIDVGYRHCESNFDEDFDWSDFTVAPCISYTVERKGDIIWHPYEPTGGRISAGLIFSQVDGDYGNENLEGNRNFGFLVGADMLSTSGWVAQMRVISYGAGDGGVSLGVMYHF